MSDTKKLCPLMWISKTDVKLCESECLTYECAWWIDGQCVEIDKANSLKQIANVLGQQEDTVQIVYRG